MKPVRKALHFMTMAAAVVLGAHFASAQGVKTDNAQSGSAAEQKQAPGGLRGPDGFTPQESSPTNGGINVRSTTGQGPAASAAKLLAEQRSKIVRRTSLRSIRSGAVTITFWSQTRF